MGKSSRRNRMRATPANEANAKTQKEECGVWNPGPVEGYDENGVPLPPGCPGSMFEIFSIDPRPEVGGGPFQHFVLPLEPYGHILSSCVRNKDWDLYAFTARAALGSDEYDKMYKAVHEYDRARVVDGMTDHKAIDARVRAFAGLEEPISLLNSE